MDLLLIKTDRHRYTYIRNTKSFSHGKNLTKKEHQYLSSLTSQQSVRNMVNMSFLYNIYLIKYIHLVHYEKQQKYLLAINFVIFSSLSRQWATFVIL